MATFFDKDHSRRERKHNRQFHAAIGQKGQGAAAAKHHQHQQYHQQQQPQQPQKGQGANAGAWQHREESAWSGRWKQQSQQWEQQSHRSSWRRRNLKESDDTSSWSPATAGNAAGGPGGELPNLASVLPPPPEELAGPVAGVIPTGALNFPVVDVVGQLEAVLQKRLAECAIGDQDKSYIKRAMDVLQSTVAKMGTKWVSTLFGSVANGFGVYASDLDVTCLEEGNTSSSQANGAHVLGERLFPLLQESASFEVTNKVLHAKVPILRLRFEGSLDIDLSCQNLKAVTNTRLLKAYASVDRRVRDVGIAAKLWAQANEVCGASSGSLSSYSFTLMAIYFLQVHPEVRLPHFDTAHFEADSKKKPDELVVKARKAWRCELTSVELLHRFFWFYASWFSWGEEVVSVRQGARLFAYQDCFSPLRGRFTPRLHIEDPYELERNLHCVLGEVQELKLQQAFADAWFSMEHGVLPVGLRPSGKVRKKLVDGTPEKKPKDEPGAAAAGDKKTQKSLQGGARAPAAAPDSCGSTTDQSCGSELSERADKSLHSDHEDGAKTLPVPAPQGGQEVRVTCHPHPLRPFDNLNTTWYCDDQCKSCTRASEGPSVRWNCSQCGTYDLCRGCVEHWRLREPEPEPLQNPRAVKPSGASVEESPFGDWAEEQPSPRVEDMRSKSLSTASARITARVAGLFKTDDRRASVAGSPVLSRSSARILARVTKACLEQSG